MKKEQPPLAIDLIVAQLETSGIPIDPSLGGTNLGPSQGMRWDEINHRDREKAILYSLGFNRPMEFAAMERFKFETNEIQPNCLRVNQNLTDYIKEHITKHNNKVGIRLYPNGDTSLPSAPFTFVGKLDNPLLQWDEGKNCITGIYDKLRKTTFTFKPGDIIDLFPSPRAERVNFVNSKFPSIDSEMIKDLSIAAGGGFHFQIRKYHPETQEFTIDFVVVLNDREPRHIYLKEDPETNEPIYTYPTRIQLCLKCNGEQLLIPKSNLDLDTIIKEGNLEEYVRYVAEQLVTNNASALTKWFQIALSANQQMKVHTLQGLFTLQKTTTEEHRVISMPFDLEAGELSQQWGHKLSVSYLPNVNPDTNLQILKRHRPAIEHPSLTNILQLIHLLITNAGINVTTPDKLPQEDLLLIGYYSSVNKVLAYVDAVEQQLKSVRQFLIIDLDATIPEDIKSSIKELIPLVSAYQEIDKHSLSIEEKVPPQHLSPTTQTALSLAKILSIFSNHPKWKNSFSNEVTSIDFNCDKLYLINFQGHDLAYWLHNGEKEELVVNPTYNQISNFIKEILKLPSTHKIVNALITYLKLYPIQNQEEFTQKEKKQLSKAKKILQQQVTTAMWHWAKGN